MDTLQQLFERTEWLEQQFDNLQQTIRDLKAGLYRQHQLQLAGQSDINFEPADEICTDNASPQNLNGLAHEPVAKPNDSSQPRENRAVPRRRGNPVSVLICDPQSEHSTFQGWVVDRSPDGICLVSEEELAVGNVVKIRPSDSVARSHWFELEIRNCRPEKNIWVAGCRFPRPLSWDEMRLFI